MARAIRSNNRFDLIVVSTCIVLALAARALPDTMREPVATGMRRTFLAPLVMLQENAERGRQSLLQADAKQSYLDSLSVNLDEGRVSRGRERPAQKTDWTRISPALGVRSAEALTVAEFETRTTMILSAGSRAGVSRLSPVIAPEDSGWRRRPGRSDDEPRHVVDASGFPRQCDVTGRHCIRNRAGAPHRSDGRLSDRAAWRSVQSDAQARRADRQLGVGRCLAAGNPNRNGAPGVKTSEGGRAPTCCSRR